MGDSLRLVFLMEVERILDTACSRLSPEEFERLKKDIAELIEDYD